MVTNIPTSEEGMLKSEAAAVIKGKIYLVRGGNLSLTQTRKTRVRMLLT